MEQHTKGPWTLYGDPKHLDVCYEDDVARSIIARMPHVLLAPEHGGSIAANARLIASAPALLAALDTIANGLEYYLDDGSNIAKTVLPLEAVEIARAAIALAKGESR